MKVLFLNEHYAPVGGAEQVMLSECRHLEAEGHRTAVVYSVQNERSFGSERPTYLIPEPGHTRESVGKVLGVLAQERPDLVHAHGGGDPELLRAVCRRVPTVRTVHSQSFLCPGESKTYWRTGKCCPLAFGPRCLVNAYRECCATRHPGRLLSRYQQCGRNLRDAQELARLIVCSEYMRGELCLNGLARNRIELVSLFPACVPSADSAPAPTARPGTVLFVGRLVRAKGWELLLEALAASQSTWRLVIVGEGPDDEEVRQCVRRLGVSHRVRLEGFREGAALSAWYAAADLVLVPSLWPEPFGMVGVEAMAHGKPVVAFDVGGIPEWLSHGETGLLVPPGEVAGLAAAIEELLMSPERRRAMGQAGLAQYQARFTEERHYGLLKAVYEAVLRQG
jgi:glycosyltransferase involved in cell wall biosynthesis